MGGEGGEDYVDGEEDRSRLGGKSRAGGQEDDDEEDGAMGAGWLLSAKGCSREISWDTKGFIGFDDSLTLTLRESGTCDRLSSWMSRVLGTMEGGAWPCVPIFASPLHISAGATE